jgi:hypothetical protein
MKDKEVIIFLFILVFASLIFYHIGKRDVQNEAIVNGFAIRTNGIIIWSK